MSESSANQTSTNPKDAIGRKKPPLHLIPPVALIHEAMAMKNGADKYGPYNWRGATVAATVYISAAMRHLADYLDGERVARDSGVHHIAHARASLGILLDAEAQGTLVDDRPTPGKAAEVMEQLCQSPVPTGAYTPAMTATEAQQAQAKATEIAKNPYYLPKRCYIAGPMRGLPELNFPAFDKARDYAKSRGWEPISPADMDRNSGIKEDYQNTFRPEETRSFVERDMDALLSLRAEHGDAIALLPGWEKSTGATAEFFVAKWLGLKCLNAVTMEPFSVSDAIYTTLGHACQASRKYMNPNSV